MEALDPELAKVAGQIAVDTAKDARGALGRLFGDAITELGLTLGDRARLYRFENLTKILEKAERIARERGYTAEQLKALPFGDALRTTEAASMEEDDDVRDLWARLIANATAPENGSPVQKVYIDLLKSLSGPEVLLLDLLWRFRLDSFRNLEELDSYNRDSEAAAETRWRKVPMQKRLASIQNLLRLRCISLRPRPIMAENLLAKMPNELVKNHFSEWSLIDAKKFERVLVQIAENMAISSGAKEHIPSSGVILTPMHGGWSFNRQLMIKAPELNYILTPIGRDLMLACSLSDDQGRADEDHRDVYE
ncbi:Abi-alpha family protein [Caulobacter sp. Root655]|uniref:Abi-alpha family protein n=1 Tax=Caulobacter sp. Root655 TaxID=1736578 RepID=UPI0009EB2B4B|nr:Abi-alpha family protein [Caulobacter sp. Root655]